MQSLLRLFENEGHFIVHFAKNVLFFKPDVVKKQTQDLFCNISKHEKIPVRYSRRFNDLYSVDFNIVNDNAFIKSKEEAISLSINYPVLHKETQTLILVDKDGNRSVRDTIRKYTGNIVSQGSGNNIVNYTISHVWARTENPYYFTSLWNICLVPEYLSFILDKPDNNGIIMAVKDLIKSICIRLYNPNALMNNKIQIEKTDQTSKELAQILIDNNMIEFVKDNGNYVRSEIESDSYSACNSDSIGYGGYFKGEIEEKQEIPTQQYAGLKAEKANDIASSFEKIDGLENREFILLLLDTLKKKNAITDDIIYFLTDINFCKITFELLRELKDGLPHKEIKRLYYESGHARYYKKDIFEYKNRRYVVCNHWYGIQRKKFLEWVNDRFSKV